VNKQNKTDKKIKVYAFNFLNLSNKYKPNVLIMDIEGLEYSLLKNTILPKKNK